MGGVLMLVASILEFIIGNTFTFVAFGTYGRFPSLQWRMYASNQKHYIANSIDQVAGGLPRQLL